MEVIQMIDEVDLCMWAKNGARYLHQVLKRIDEVIPSRNVNKKIFVDDYSKDATVEIAKDFSWDVYENEEGYVLGGAKEALRHVESEFFVSIEQDVLLARSWWKKIPPHMEDPMCMCAQGARVITSSILTHIDAARWELYQKLRWASRAPDRSLDNNLWRTDALQKLGGFPSSCPMYVDNELYKKVSHTPYKWVVDSTVVSLHLRENNVLSAGRHVYNVQLLSRRRHQLSALTILARWAGETLWSPRVCVYDSRAFPTYVLLQAYLLKALAIKGLREL